MPPVSRTRCKHEIMGVSIKKAYTFTTGIDNGTDMRTSWLQWRCLLRPISYSPYERQFMTGLPSPFTVFPAFTQRPSRWLFCSLLQIICFRFLFVIFSLCLLCTEELFRKHIWQEFSVKIVDYPVENNFTMRICHKRRKSVLMKTEAKDKMTRNPKTGNFQCKIKEAGTLVQQEVTL